jgi:tetratricopeptide (TPR) repeat protein
MSDRLLCGKENIIHSLSRNQRQIQVGENSADPQLLAWGLNGKGYALLRLGRLDEAVADLQRALKLHKSILTYQYVIMAGSDLGECYLQQDKLEKALQILEECNRTVDEKGLRDYSVTWPRNNLAEAYLIAVEQASEEYEKNRWLKKAKHACALAIKHGKKFRVGLPKARRLKGRYEWLRGRHKAAQKWWLQSLDVAEELGSKYDSAMAHLEIGKYQQERAHLEQAEVIFDDIGAKLDLARARDLLA